MCAGEVWDEVRNLYIAQDKRECGIIGRENYNKARAEVVKVPRCPEEKERVIREALEYFKMLNLDKNIDTNKKKIYNFI